MPRDSHLLTPTSRALLRAARAGCIYIRHAPKQTDEEPRDPPTDVEEQQSIHMADRSFIARKWTPVPRHLEPAEVEFLAKRRHGLPSLYGAAVVNVDGGETSAPMRRTRFKKVDPTTGNISIYEAWVPEGHKIEGEITEDAQTVASANSEVIVTPEAPAPGTVVDGVGVVNSEGVVIAEAGSAAVMTPPKRRPPPPKRKGKGIGRGRRKKVMFAPGEGADASLVRGAEAGPADGTATGHFKEESVDASRASVDQSGQDDDEEEDGDEGEESDGDESMMDAKTPETPHPQAPAETANNPAYERVVEPADTSMADAARPPPPESATSSQPPARQQESQDAELSSQDQPSVPAAADEEKQREEKPTVEDIGITDYHHSEPVSNDSMTSASQPTQTIQSSAHQATTTASETDQKPHEVTVDSGTVKQELDDSADTSIKSLPATHRASPQAETPEQVHDKAAPTLAREAADNDVGVVPATTAQHQDQKQGDPADQMEQNPEPEVKKEADDQANEHIEHPSGHQLTGQSELQTTQNTPERSEPPIEEPTAEQQVEQPLQTDHHEIKQTMDHTSALSPEQPTPQPGTQAQMQPTQQEEPSTQPSPPATTSDAANFKEEPDKPAESTAEQPDSNSVQDAEPGLEGEQNPGATDPA